MVSFLDELGECSGCHRMPDRSFFYKGHQFPVCARCTGVCIGQLSAILINCMISVPMHISILLLSIMGFDWSIQEFKIKSSTNFRRLIGGFGLYSLYANVIRTFIYCHRKKETK